MSLPEMSPEDRAKALELAKRARSERAAILGKVSRGQLTVADVLKKAEKDESTARIKTKALLKAVPGYGEIRSTKLMNKLGIAESRRLRGLGYRQRAGLIEHFSEAKKN